MMRFNPAEYQLFVYNLEIKIGRKNIPFVLEIEVFKVCLGGISIWKVRICMEKA